MAELDNLLEHLIELRGSDLHLKVGSNPHVRVNGKLQRTAFDPLTASELESLVAELLPVSRSQELADSGQISIAHGLAGLGRFRVNIYRQRGSYGLAIRWVVPGAPPIDTLGLPASVRQLSEELTGVIVVAGPASSGKTTTAAALLDRINATRSTHIVTLEDPIEVLLSDKLSMVSQRELGVDTRTFADALRGVNRLDPDVIFVSDLPDADSVQEVLAAAAAGSLVIATIATTSVDAALNRIVSYFPTDRQEQVRHGLAAQLRGVVYQQMFDRIDSDGRIPVCEVLTATAETAQAVAQGDSATVLRRLMGDGAANGMQTFDQALLAVVREGQVHARDALGAARSPSDLQAALQPTGH